MENRKTNEEVLEMAKTIDVPELVDGIKNNLNFQSITEYQDEQIDKFLEVNKRAREIRKKNGE